MKHTNGFWDITQTSNPKAVAESLGNRVAFLVTKPAHGPISEANANMAYAMARKAASYAFAYIEQTHAINAS